MVRWCCPFTGGRTVSTVPRPMAVDTTAPGVKPRGSPAPAKNPRPCPTRRLVLLLVLLPLAVLLVLVLLVSIFKGAVTARALPEAAAAATELVDAVATTGFAAEGTKVAAAVAFPSKGGRGGAATVAAAASFAALASDTSRARASAAAATAAAANFLASAALSAAA